MKRFPIVAMRVLQPNGDLCAKYYYMGAEQGYFRIICAVCGGRTQPGKTAYSETIVSVCDHCRGQGRFKPKRSPRRGLKQNAIYELHPRKDHCGVDLISDALPIRAAVLRRAKRN